MTYEWSHLGNPHFVPTIQRERVREIVPMIRLCSSRTSLVESWVSETFPVCCTTVLRTVLLSSMRDQPLASSISTVLLVLRPNVRTGRRPFLAAGTSFRSTTAFRVSLLAVFFYFLLLSTICRDNQGSIVTFCKASDSSPSRLTFLLFSGLYFQSGILGKSLRNSHSEQRCEACTILQASDLR